LTSACWILWIIVVVTIERTCGCLSHKFLFLSVQFFVASHGHYFSSLFITSKIAQICICIAGCGAFVIDAQKWVFHYFLRYFLLRNELQYYIQHS
jgi:hypothetical protein